MTPIIINSVLATFKAGLSGIIQLSGTMNEIFCNDSISSFRSASLSKPHFLSLFVVVFFSTFLFWTIAPRTYVQHNNLTKSKTLLSLFYFISFSPIVSSYYGVTVPVAEDVVFASTKMTSIRRSQICNDVKLSVLKFYMDGSTWRQIFNSIFSSYLQTAHNS